MTINRVPRITTTIGDGLTTDIMRAASQQEAYQRIQDFDLLQMENVPWFDVRTYGALTSNTDNGKYFQSAVDAATVTGGRVFVPPGTWQFDATTLPTGATTYYSVAMKNNVHVYGMPGATLKFKLGASTDAVPKGMAIFGSASNVTNFGLHDLTFDFNGTNNGVGGNIYPQAAVCFTSVNGRGNDIYIDGCTFKNSAGSNIILAHSGTDSSAYVMGKRWRIKGNTFFNNGLDVNDFSAIWGWAEQMQVTDNIFYQSTMPAHTSIKFACELHGANSIFRGNIVENYTGMNWVAPNYTSAVENILIDGNIAKVLSFGVRFYRNAATEKEVRRVHITNNQIEFNNSDPGAAGANGVHMNMPYSMSDVLIKGNTIRRPTGSSYAAHGVFLGCSGTGESFTNITIEGNQLEGMSYGVYGAAAVGTPGVLGSVRVSDNVVRNLRGTNPVGVLFTNDGAAVSFAEVVVTDNEFTNDEGANTNFGIYTIGYFDTLRVQGNHYRALFGGSLTTSGIVACNYYLGEEMRKIWTAVPAVGTWAVGDIVYHSDAASGEPMGWYCTVAPSTWRALANLA